MRGESKCVWGSLMIKAERTKFWMEKKERRNQNGNGGLQPTEKKGELKSEWEWRTTCH